MPDITTDNNSPAVPAEDLLSWQRNAHELHVLLGAIACMAAPSASLELKKTIQLARTISDELYNDIEVMVQ